jgi:hypothetical protein
MRKRERLNDDDRPSQSAVDGRRPDGRFGPGNRLSLGNSNARKAASSRAAFYNTITTVDFEAVCKKLLAKAKSGESWAIKLVMAYQLGPPVPVDLQERIERIEAILENKQ